ncbi:MAG TPA: guanylate kinase [Candidatus Gastranaerophilales bacterium]|nr:guanylate kinase [Candidatus Gastranaerophilales bacterium]
MDQVKKGKLFVISGPSGVGKGTLVNLLRTKYPEIIISTSVTTRNPRPGELSGIHYFFIKKEDFLFRINQGNFLEWTEFAGNYYGTDKNIVELTIEQGHNLLLEIDVKGALQVKKHKSDAILIFIEPPSIEELKSRLFKRETESEQEIYERLSIVKSEIDKKTEFNYCLLNDKLDRAFSDLESIVLKEINATESCK